MIMSECVVSNTTQSVTQYTIYDETYKNSYHWRISLPFKFWLSASDSQCHSDGPFVALHSTSSVANDTLPQLWLLLIVTLQKRLCDCYMSCGLYRSVQTKTRCRRRRTRGNGLGRQRAICMNGVARNKNILALDECTYRDDGLLQNTDCLFLNRRYCPGFWLVKPVVLERFYHANWPL